MADGGAPRDVDAGPVAYREAGAFNDVAIALLPGADERMSEIIPLRGWAEIRDIANLAVYLGSDESRFITGSLIPVDGGEIMGHHVSRFAPQEWAAQQGR